MSDGSKTEVLQMSEELNQNEVVSENTTVVEPENKPEAKSFTQEEIDKIVADRIARERKKLDKFADYDEIKTKLSEFTKAEEERKQSEMTEVERLQAQLDKLAKQAQEAEETKSKTLENANKRLVKSEFKVLAKDLGVRKDALDDAFVLADMSGVEIDDDGNVSGVKEALETLKKSKAYLFGVTDYADPSPGQHETKRDAPQEQTKRKLQELADKAKKTGRIEDKIAYANFKSELGI
jgi:hypothetical protein